MGIGPTYSAWKAAALPLCYTRTRLSNHPFGQSKNWWKGLDSNQRTQKRTDLQSVGFNHSPTFPQGALRFLKQSRSIMPFFYCFVKRFFVEYVSMKNIRALLIDCDGVLYDNTEYLDVDIVRMGLIKTLSQYHISWKEFEQTRAELKQINIRGLFNAVLELCNKYHIIFDDFAIQMTQNIDYSHISQDEEMVMWLQKVGNLLPTYIVTNNIRPHLMRIFQALHGKAFQNISKELNLHIVTIENTLEFDPRFNRTLFHPKQMENQFQRLCTQINVLPKYVALIDDSDHIYTKAEKQGLIPIPTQGPAHTKSILKELYQSLTKDNL